MKRIPFWYVGLMLVLLSSGGATCRQWARPTDALAPAVFTGPPTLEEIIFAVNANSNRVSQLSTESASVETPGAPILRASLSLERPLRIRLRGKLIGQVLDLGSNDELFWFWAKSDPDRALYFAYHAEFVQAAANEVLPVGPDWLIEAIGLVNLDPSGFHEGPSQRPDGNLEVRSRIERRGAYFTRVLVIDSKYGWIKEQHVLDTSGRLLAVARCSNHRTYPASGVNLPHRIHIELPPAQMAFQLEVTNYTVNQLAGDAKDLFKEPYYDGFVPVNLAQPRPVQPPADAENPQASSGYSADHSAYSLHSAYAPSDGSQPHTAYRLKYRGYGGQH